MASSASLYAGLPTDNSVYCSQKSDSSISAAARNLRIAASPSLIPASDHAAPATPNATPAAATDFTNVRRPMMRRSIVFKFTTPFIKLPIKTTTLELNSLGSRAVGTVGKSEGQDHWEKRVACKYTNADW